MTIFLTTSGPSRTFGDIELAESYTRLNVESAIERGLEGHRLLRFRDDGDHEITLNPFCIVQVREA